MIDRRTFLALLGAGTLAAPRMAGAQQASARTAKTLGLTIPQALLLRVDQVVQ
jgi:anaerobic selenocysteine-containing dehydrogenase